MLDFHEQLFDSTDRHRRLDVRRLDAEFTRAEHREIMDAAVSRDTALTIKLLNDSIDTLITRRNSSEANGEAISST
ncbi:hypothetical protein QTH87_20565 [Variovorax sp. J22P168]|uniref:hypothetical protein n=1 Tax=Variovorax jilinensis TaxID=3053513 RepID=UPI0025792259|nr:hypothetical protein [Variovorax sp. J22P168]MDM0014849.1 hypothetical protein [Variovorax sp. J22P168]